MKTLALQFIFMGLASVNTIFIVNSLYDDSLLVTTAALLVNWIVLTIILNRNSS